jgi:hypothetical protein
VTATCPNGHLSGTTDYCDRCGARIEAVPDALHADTGSAPVTSTSPANAPCPECGVPRTGRDRYCEGCGHDFSRVPPAAAGEATGWAAQVAPDRAYFERTAPDGLAFPEGEDVRTVALEAERMRIGRRRPSGGDAPEIELGDPAVSRLHATLVRAADGSWAIVDEGSSNGTTINAAADPIAPHVEVPLEDGDSVHLGAWTTITVALRSRAA